MGTTCQIGEVRSLGLAADAPWEDVLNAILLAANQHRSAGGRVGPDSYEAARGPVPPQLPIEYIRAVNGRLGTCVRFGSGLTAVGGLAMLPVGYAMAFGGGADPTDPWSALLMVTLRMRYIAETRATTYGRMWSDALPYPRSDRLRSLASSWGINLPADWDDSGTLYGDNRPYVVTNAARADGWRSSVQFPTNAGPQAGQGCDLICNSESGRTYRWPIPLMYDLDFWGMVLLEMFLEAAVPGRGGELATKLWKGVLNEGNGGLVGYYSDSGQPSMALASLLHDGIVWVRPLVPYAQSLAVGYNSLPSGQRQAMNLTGDDINKLNGAFVKVYEVLNRVPEWAQGQQTTVGPYWMQGEESADGTLSGAAVGWSQPDVVIDSVRNSMGVPEMALYDTLARFDREVMVWAGYQMIPPIPPPGPVPPPVPVPLKPPGKTKPTSPIIPLVFGLTLPLLGYWVWGKWRTPT